MKLKKELGIIFLSGVILFFENLFSDNKWVIVPL
ncbi:UNVERIFIED_ORG: hypothetical protein J2X74_005378 [Bacillus sp. 1751]|jgi:hypothetical protein|nr:hypothetical protein [Bacillus sp. 1751]